MNLIHCDAPGIARHGSWRSRVEIMLTLGGGGRGGWIATAATQAPHSQHLPVQPVQVATQVQRTNKRGLEDLYAAYVPWHLLEPFRWHTLLGVKNRDHFQCK
jgi:hypothetical protein